MLETRPTNSIDIIRWTDTSVLVADCLTKAMREDFLMKVLDTNLWNNAQTAEARAVEARKQEMRSKTRISEPESDWASEPEPDNVETP